jgi:hypothetical protein
MDGGTAYRYNRALITSRKLLRLQEPTPPQVGEPQQNEERKTYAMGV